jgi:hypothetical protein
VPPFAQAWLSLKGLAGASGLRSIPGISRLSALRCCCQPTDDSQDRGQGRSIPCRLQMFGCAQIQRRRTILLTSLEHSEQTLRCFSITAVTVASGTNAASQYFSISDKKGWSLGGAWSSITNNYARPARFAHLGKTPEQCALGFRVTPAAGRR